MVERTCIVCRKKDDKETFIKVVFNKSGEILIDENKKLEGRGAYICNDVNCINKCAKVRAFNKCFKTAIPQEFYEEIMQKFGTQ